MLQLKRSRGKSGCRFSAETESEGIAGCLIKISSGTDAYNLDKLCQSDSAAVHEKSYS